MTYPLEGISYPVSRDELVQSAMEAQAPADVINTLKALPREQYVSRDEVLRDLAEAARRFGMGNLLPEEDARVDRRNIGRDAVEGALPPKTRHP